MEPITIPFILDKLDRNAVEMRDQIAVSDEATVYTWAQLRQAALAVAAQLLAYPIQGKPVAIAAQRRSETLALLYGALYAGAFYLPLDPNMPQARLAHIRENADYPLVLGCGQRPEAFAADIWCDCLSVCHDPRPLSDEQAQELARRRETLHGDSPLYLVYTSGSTGVPKGVLKQYKAVECFVQSFLREYPIAAGDVLGNQTPFFFDASAKDVYWSLYTGCRLAIIPTQLFSFPVQLLQHMQDVGVTVISWVPSALSIVAQLDALSCVTPTHLRQVFFVGDVMPAKYLAYWQHALPEVRFVNLYGSSEIAGVCLHCPIDHIYPDDSVLPLGRPFPHCKVTLLGPDGPVTASAQEGELLIESEALAVGYFRDPQRTQAVFTHTESGMCLHTGDIALYREDGSLVFTSRRDYQIKHMGYRIELGEIETAAAALPEVAAAGCVYDRRRSQIVLFCQLSSGEAMRPADVLRLLRDKLCAYMLPQKVLILEQMPLNPNGKIDRPALLQQYEAARPRRRHNQQTQ